LVLFIVEQVLHLSENIPKKDPLNRRSLGYAPPDFLLRFVALMDFMRLSLRKDAHVGLSCAAWQESRVGMTKGRAALPWSAVARPKLVHTFEGRVPHISLVFREMWDTSAPSL
jgi:hypothetical protein